MVLSLCNGYGHVVHVVTYQSLCYGLRVTNNDSSHLLSFELSFMYQTMACFIQSVPNFVNRKMKE